jgi:hypothetical protein
LETVCFTSLSVLDFHFAIFGFADFSWLGRQNENIYDRFPYSGFGLGVRIRNERLVFNTLQIRFSFYPNIPAHSHITPFDISGEPVLNLPSFLPTEPALVQYQ